MGRPRGAHGATIESATSEEVAAFVHCRWIPNHSGESRTVLLKDGGDGGICVGCSRGSQR